MATTPITREDFHMDLLFWIFTLR